MKNSFSAKQKTVFGVVTAVFFCILILIALSISGSRSYSFDMSVLAPDHVAEDGSLVIGADTEDVIHTTRFSLRRGTYTISIAYASDTDYSVFIPLDNDNNTTVYLPEGEGTSTGEIALEWPTDRAYFVFNPPEKGNVRIDSIHIGSDKMIYTDGIFQVLLLILLYIIVMLLFVKSAEWSRDKKIVLLFMILMAVIINLPYYLQFYPSDTGAMVFQNPLISMTRFGIDTRAHLLRLEGDMYGMLDGQFPVVISPNFLNENGELTFLYPSIFLYPFAIMRILGASMPFVFRLMCVIINIATLVSVYFSCRKMGAGYDLSLVISAVYLFEPHRLWVMFGQGAGCGAGIAGVFAPLAIVGVFLILKREKDGIYLLAFGVTGIMQSHITSLVLLASLLLLLFIVFIKDLLKEDGAGIKLVGKAVLLGLLMNLGVMVPFLFYYFSGVNTSALVWGNWDEVLLGFPDFLTNDMSLFYVSGLIITIAAVAVFRTKSTEYRMAATMTAYTAFFFLMTTSLFPWDTLMRSSSAVMKFTDVMQLPERFYSTMLPALLLSLLLFLKARRPGKIWGRIAALAMSGTLLYGAVINIGGFLTTGPLLYDQVTGDMNTKQLFDYLPDRDDLEPEMEFSGTASLSDWDNVESISYHKRGTRVDYAYITGQQGVYAEFPLLDYEGYTVWDESGNVLDHETGDMGRIRVNLTGDGSQHEVHIAYKVKTAFMLLYTLSLVFSAAILFYWTLRSKAIKSAEVDKTVS